MKQYNVVCLALFWLLCLNTNAQIGKRYALVIGNNSYEKNPLVNPKNDAILMAKTLEECDFEVTLYTDIGKNTMVDAIYAFTDSVQADKNNVGLY